jgi:hypothetical protein
MRNTSQWLRLAMAAGMYLLVMWGYLALPSAQWFAVCLALIMSSMLVFWVTESVSSRGVTHQANRGDHEVARRYVSQSTLQAVASTPVMQGYKPGVSPKPSLAASILRLDSLKSELTLQYAQFGRDQSLLNSNGLGSWHGIRKPGAR